MGNANEAEPGHVPAEPTTSTHLLAIVPTHCTAPQINFEMSRTEEDQGGMDLTYAIHRSKLLVCARHYRQNSFALLL